MIIGIITGILVAIAIDTYLYAFYKVERDLYKIEVRDIQQEFDKLQSQNDSLESILKAYRMKNDSLSFVVLLNEQKYKELKNETSQKVDSIHDLPLDLAIEYFTNQISKEGHLGW